MPSSSTPSRRTSTLAPGSLEDQLLAAARSGDAETVRLLVARGAAVTLPGGQAGQSALQAARARGYAPVIATLEAALEAKPDGSPTHSVGLLAAATKGDADAAAIALRQGADVETRDGNGRTPLVLAATHDRWVWPGCSWRWAPTRTRRTRSKTGLAGDQGDWQRRDA